MSSTAVSILLLIPLVLWPAMSFFPYLQSLLTRTLGLDGSSEGSTSSQDNDVSQSSSSSSSLLPEDAPGSFEPSAMDVTVAKIMLQQGLRLPPEVVLSVLDFAEYWPHTTAFMDRGVTVVSGRERENRFILRSKPLGLIKRSHYDDRYYTLSPAPPLKLSDDGEYPLSQFQEWIRSPTSAVQRPCRKIVFTIQSHDQGWAHNARNDRGTYRGSWTWFEAGLERFDRNATRPEEALEEEPGRREAGARDEAGPSSGEKDAAHPGGVELPEPYLPVYSLRSIRPVVEEDRPAFHHDLLPSDDLTIQVNKTATSESKTHRVVWSWNDNVRPPTSAQLKEIGRGGQTGGGDFVRDLKLGDVVTVWAKSRFGGWANHVESVRLDVYWAL